MALTHWKALSDNTYIGAYAFQPGQEITATISSVRREMVVGADGKKEQCTVVHFSERDIKPLILNATNAKVITKVADTPYIEEWVGKRIVMGVEKVRAFGDVVDAVRVKKKKPVPAKTEAIPPCADCGQPIGSYGDKPPEWVAQYTAGKYGVCLCIECGMKRKEREEDGKENT